ncbi:MAG: preprotein translocase subunit SecG [Hydrogenophaga sp.]
MQVLLNILQAVQILTAIGMVGLILIQHGKGADAGAAFGGGGGGGGGSASLFGASGSANFLSRSTAVLAALFLSATLGLAYFGNLRAAPSAAGSVLENSSVPAAVDLPAAQQIPTQAGSVTATPATPAAPATEVPAPLPATGAAQIPAK